MLFVEFCLRSRIALAQCFKLFAKETQSRNFNIRKHRKLVNSSSATVRTQLFDLSTDHATFNEPRKSSLLSMKAPNTSIYDGFN